MTKTALITGITGITGQDGSYLAELGWKPTTRIRELVDEMVLADYNGARRVALLREHGFDTPVSIES